LTKREKAIGERQRDRQRDTHRDKEREGERDRKKGRERRSLDFFCFIIINSRLR